MSDDQGEVVRWHEIERCNQSGRNKIDVDEGPSFTAEEFSDLLREQDSDNLHNVTGQVKIPPHSVLPDTYLK